MTPFRTDPRPEDHLSTYWNALVRNAPAEELTRLARLVDPADIDAIEGIHAAHERYEPDPFFARRLEEQLMEVSSSSDANLITGRRFPRLPLSGSRDVAPVSHRRARASRPSSGWPSISPLHIALAVLLVLASAGGTWWLTNRDGEPQRLIAPELIDSTEDPADYSDHPIVGAWNVPVGGPEPDHLPCWCLAIFTADGLAMAMDPRPDWRAPDMSSETVAVGIWQPTGERTAVSVVRFPATDGGYIERTFTWTVSEDGSTATSTGTQRSYKPDGMFATLPNLAEIDMVRITMPDDAPVSTPVD